jgi:hypothetical protein
MIRTSDLNELLDIQFNTKIGYLTLSTVFNYCDILWKEEIQRLNFSDEHESIDYRTTIYNCRFYVNTFGLHALKAKEATLVNARDVQFENINRLLELSDEELWEVETGITEILCNPVKKG